MLATFPSVVVHEADIAAVAVTALTQDGYAGQTYPLTGPEALTPVERSRILAEATVQDIAFVHLSEDAERARLQGHGYDEDYVEFGMQLATTTPDAAAVVLPTFTDVTGRPPRPFAQWAHGHPEHFRTTPCTGACRPPLRTDVA